MDVGITDGMLMPSDVIASRMTRWYVGGGKSHPRISLSASHFAATMGKRDSEFWSRFMVSLWNLVIHEYS